jgi:hypothetical protein
MFFILSSCSKIEIDENSKLDERYEMVEDVAVLFQYEYSNAAWGYQHNGWFMDSLGVIRGYSQPDTWNWPDSLGYISYDELLQNINQYDTVYTDISISDINEKKELILATIDGEISDLVHRMADAGQSSIYCFCWDKDKEMYKRQLLETKGDFERYNKESEAVQLSDWLIDIGKNIQDCFMWSCNE